MILSGQTIRKLCVPWTEQINMGNGNIDWIDHIPDPMITPYVERTVLGGRSYGLSIAGYDIRVGKITHSNKRQGDIWSCRLEAGDFALASSVERIKMPNDVIAFVKDKSSWAREGLCVQNTVLEPGWEGFITLELSFHRPQHNVVIREGDAIAQVIFQRLDEPAEKPYTGKYQNQEDEPVEARSETPLAADLGIIQTSVFPPFNIKQEDPDGR